jgi:hypothetical protein
MHYNTSDLGRRKGHVEEQLERRPRGWSEAMRRSSIGALPTALYFNTNALNLNGMTQ